MRTRTIASSRSMVVTGEQRVTLCVARVVSSLTVSRRRRSNAFTASEKTVYYFDVHPAHLVLFDFVLACLRFFAFSLRRWTALSLIVAKSEMLDIFSQFFVAPLFTESATLRELNAVQNEHSKNLQSDSWRNDLVSFCLLLSCHRN